MLVFPVGLKHVFPSLKLAKIIWLQYLNAVWYFTFFASVYSGFNLKVKSFIHLQVAQDFVAKTIHCLFTFLAHLS